MTTSQQTVKGAGTIVPTEREKSEWSRMAQAAYRADRNDIGHRFSGAATLRIGEPMKLSTFDALQSAYRAWLCFNEFEAQIPIAPVVDALVRQFDCGKGDA